MLYWYGQYLQPLCSHYATRVNVTTSRRHNLSHKHVTIINKNIEANRRESTTALLRGHSWNICAKSAFSQYRCFSCLKHHTENISESGMPLIAARRKLRQPRTWCEITRIRQCFVPRSKYNSCARHSECLTAKRECQLIQRFIMQPAHFTRKFVSFNGFRLLPQPVHNS